VTPPVPTGASRRRWWLRRGLPALAVLAVAGVVVALIVAGRGGSGPERNAAATGSSPPAKSSFGPPLPSPSPSPAPVTQPAAVTMVSRPGVPASARTVAGATAEFTAPASWADGASVRLTEAHHQVSSGQGPGALVGQPEAVLSLSLTNGSSAPLDVSGVVVQAVYGFRDKVASPLYDGSTLDFSGTVAPGATATAVYAFAIPTDQLGDVRLTVDLDGHHFPVVFAGVVPAR
jgi:hypothetical protein